MSANERFVPEVKILRNKEEGKKRTISEQSEKKQKFRILKDKKYLYRNNQNYQILDQNGRKYCFSMTDSKDSRNRSKWRSITPTAFISDFYKKKDEAQHGVPTTSKNRKSSELLKISEEDTPSVSVF